MKKTHRKLHHLFWYLGTPLLLLFLIFVMPDAEDKGASINKVPQASKIAVLP
ncbi:MAG: hypothetical protein GKR95_19290 [Gammaproteobacteria bacterium]|nr:hypothetical protein [Gammaproteobacteria bacterium]